MIEIRGKKMFIGGSEGGDLDRSNMDDDFLSDDIEGNNVIDKFDDVYPSRSIFSSDLPFRSGYTNSLLCPCPIPGQNRPDTMGYIHARQQMKKLVKSRDDLIRAQVLIEEERRRSCWLIGMCIGLTFLCGMLFFDQMPDRWRGSTNTSNQSYSYTLPSNMNSDITKGDKNSINSGSAVTTLQQKQDGTATQQQQQEEESTVVSNSEISKQQQNNVLESFQSSMNSNSASATGGNLNNVHTNTSETKTAPIHSAATTNADPNTDSQYTNTNTASSLSAMTVEEKKQFALMQEVEENVEKLNKYLKWNIPFKPDRDIPVYWHVPLSGNNVADEILSHCYGLVQAVDNVGLLYGHEHDEGLSVITNEDSARYVNVDMGTVEGIQRAKDLGLLNHDIVDLIKTSYLYETAEMFKPVSRYAKCFTILRDPIDRAIGVFHRLQSTSNHPTIQNMTLLEYAKSPLAEENWMVRYLSNELEDELQQEHTEMAQHILGRKCLIGFTDQFEESMRRFAKYFGWDKKVALRKVLDCEEKLSGSDNDVTVQFPVHNWKQEAPEGGEVWEALKLKNSHDLELFSYAKKLFESQAIYGH